MNTFQAHENFIDFPCETGDLLILNAVSNLADKLPDALRVPGRDSPMSGLSGANLVENGDQDIPAIVQGRHTKGAVYGPRLRQTTCKRIKIEPTPVAEDRTERDRIFLHKKDGPVPLPTFRISHISHRLSKSGHCAQKIFAAGTMRKRSGTTGINHSRRRLRN
jgi:hypothetical protein